jgi:hypothetical protein
MKLIIRKNLNRVISKKIIIIFIYQKNKNKYVIKKHEVEDLKQC